MSVCVLSSEEEFDSMKKLDCVIYFTAMWCGPCRNISPHYVTLANKYVDLKFAKVDVDELNTEDILSVPTFRVYKDGNIVDELIGADAIALESLIVRNSINSSNRATDL